MFLKTVWIRVSAIQTGLAVWGTAFLLSVAQERHVVYFFGNLDMSDLIRAVRAERGVLAGYPHWRFFQSRLLGPSIEKFLNAVFGFNFLIAHMIVAVAVLTIATVLMFEAGRALGGRQHGWTALFALQALFTLMMSRPWL